MENRERHLSTADIAASSEQPEVQPGRIDSDVHRKQEDVIALGDTKAEQTGRNNLKNDQSAPLFSNDSIQGFRSRWTALQTGFVDEPRRSVEQADELVAEVIKDLASTFSDERTKLEHQWDQGDKVSTEDLRLVLRRYRSFFDRFLSI